MKALQRQVQYQPQKILQIWSKPKKYEDLLRKTTKMIKGVEQIPLKGLLNFQHRRKYQKPSFNQIPSCGMPRKSEQLSNNSKLQENNRKLSHTKRHTHQATDLKDLFKDKHNKIQAGVFKDFQRDRAKCSILSQQTMYHEQFNKSRSGWKLKERLNKTKEKTQKSQSQQPHSKTFKKFDKLNETDFSFCANSEGGSFLDLIKKFKFQNLKTVSEIDKCLYSPGSRKQTRQTKLTRQQRKRQAQFPSFRRTFQNVDRQKQTEQANITTLFHKSKDTAHKLLRKISSLSPWEMAGDNYFSSAAEMEEHI